MCDVQAWKTDSLHLLLQKDLQPSDIGSLGRIILPKVGDTFLFVAFYFSYDGSILARDLLVLIVISLSLECKTNIMTLNLLPEFDSRNSGHSLYDCHSEISVRLYICLSNTPAVVNCEVSLFLQSQTWRYHSHMVA